MAAPHSLAEGKRTTGGRHRRALDSRMNLNLSASFGFIALFGVAMLNGVVLVRSINQMTVSGCSIREAFLAGARRRLRPVLITAFVASFGFIPMAVATSTGTVRESTPAGAFL
jgi:Cu/Ag efflux pump CusA